MNRLDANAAGANHDHRRYRSFYKLPFRVVSFPRPGSNVPRVARLALWCPRVLRPRKFGREARRIRGGNHYDTPAIRGIFDSRILLVALSTEGPVMTGLSAEVSAPPVAADQHAFSPSVGGLLKHRQRRDAHRFLCHRWREC
jgi:hypothetical protein